MKQKSNTSRKPVIIKVDKTLDQYLTKGLFKEKLAKVNHVLKTTMLPEIVK